MPFSFFINCKKTSVPTKETMLLEAECILKDKLAYQHRSPYFSPSNVISFTLVISTGMYLAERVVNWLKFSLQMQEPIESKTMENNSIVYNFLINNLELKIQGIILISSLVYLVQSYNAHYYPYHQSFPQQMRFTMDEIDTINKGLELIGEKPLSHTMYLMRTEVEPYLRKLENNRLIRDSLPQFPYELIDCIKDYAPYSNMI